MAEYTPNYNLYKPNRNDTDIEVDTSLSSNFTKIDTAIKTNANEIATVKTSLNSSVTSINSNVTALQTSNSTNTTAISTLKTAFEVKHNTNGTFKGIVDTDISNTAAIKANKLAIQKLYKKTISPSVSATANTYGTAVELTPYTGYSSMVPLNVLGTALVPATDEVITLSVTATFSDSSTSEVTKEIGQSFSLTDSDFFTLFKDNLYITKLTFKVKSSIAASKVIVTVNNTGFYL